MRTLLAFGLDALMVAAYTLASRRSRDEEMTLWGLWISGWPFWTALLVAWLLMLQWKNVLSAYRAVGVWLVTCVLGLLLRSLFTDGSVPWALVVSTTAVLGYLLLGWRLLVFLVRSRRVAALTDIGRSSPRRSPRGASR